jgi:glycosyltransferase involved in cell wall biosynthesis
MKLCVMPHLPYWGIRTRGWAMARALSSLPGVDCDFLVWGTVEPDTGARARRVLRTLAGAATNQLPRRPRQRDGVTIHTMPFLDTRLVTFGVPLAVIRAHNRQRLAKALRRLAPDWFITGGTHTASVPWEAGVRTVVDVFDDHFAGVHDLGELRRLEPEAAAMLERADVLVGASRAIAEKYGAIAQRPVHCVPNGFEPQAPPTPAQREQARARFSLPHDARILTYVGNHGSHAGIGFLLDVVTRLHARDARILCAIGGPIGDRAERRAAQRNPAVRVIDSLDPADVPLFLAAADVGLLPTEMSEFRSHALPLKILEYGASCLTTVATPLRELKLQRFPHVRFAPYGDVAGWVDAVEEALDTPFQPVWAASLESFAWPAVAGSLLRVLAAAPATRSWPAVGARLGVEPITYNCPTEEDSRANYAKPKR